MFERNPYERNPFDLTPAIQLADMPEEKQNRILAVLKKTESRPTLSDFLSDEALTRLNTLMEQASKNRCVVNLTCSPLQVIISPDTSTTLRENLKQGVDMLEMGLEGGRAMLKTLPR